MDLPTISVVTPSYNQAPYLEQTLRSVLDQDYPNLEYIVLDAGSQDGSREIIERFAHRLSFWRSSPDEGQASAIREGFERAEGEILTWLNSDDLLAQGALWTVADAWRRHGGGVIVAGACQLFGPASSGARHMPTFTERLDERVEMPVGRMLDLGRHWFPGEFFYQPEVFFPRAAHDAVGGVDPSFFYTMDYDLWVRLALGGTQVVVLDETLAYYREHCDQKTADRGALYREMIKTANAYLQMAPLPAEHRRRLAARNRRCRHPFVRAGYKLRYRLSNGVRRVRR